MWDLQNLGVPLNLSQAGHKLHFTLIGQPWFRTLAKRYLEYNVTIYSASDTKSKLTALQNFSSFLAQEAPETGVTDLDRTLLLR